jgi:hypothetical protein
MAGFVVSSGAGEPRVAYWNDYTAFFSKTTNAVCIRSEGSLHPSSRTYHARLLAPGETEKPTMTVATHVRIGARRRSPFPTDGVHGSAPDFDTRTAASRLEKSL